MYDYFSYTHKCKCLDFSCESRKISFLVYKPTFQIKISLATFCPQQMKGAFCHGYQILTAAGLISTQRGPKSSKIRNPCIVKYDTRYYIHFWVFLSILFEPNLLIHLGDVLSSLKCVFVTYNLQFNILMRRQCSRINAILTKPFWVICNCINQ